MPTIREVEDDEVISDDQHSGDDGSEDDNEPTAGPSEPTPSSSKKKKKKRSKVAKMINKLKGNEVPQAVVEKVMEGVKKDGNPETQGLDESQVRAILEQLKINDVLQGKAGLGGKNKKDAGDHKVRRDLVQLEEDIQAFGIVLVYAARHAVRYNRVLI